MVTDASSPPERAKHIPKHAASQTKGFFRRFWWVFLAVPLVFLTSVLATLYVSYRQIELPEALPPIRTSFLFDRNGEQLSSLHGAVDRKIVPLGQISENLQHAVLATEDAGFYDHPGIDLRGIVTAAWTDLVKRDTVAGASTITQQLVKNVYAGQYIENRKGVVEYIVPPRSIKEKVREALLAIKLEHELGKDQILAKYLNTVYFGHGAYGAEAAAQTYFAKAASELTVSESAVLAAVLHAPSLYDPIKSTFDNKFRRDYTLDQMAKYGYITSEEAAALKAEECCGIPKEQQRAETRIDAPIHSEYFVDYTRQWLFDNPKFGSAKVYGAGLQITTSLDLRMQEAAERAIKSHLPPTEYNPEASLVTIDNETGEVLAMVGGLNWQESKVNLATQQCEGCGQQAGSAFKPFTLAAALEQDFSLGAWWQGPVDDLDQRRPVRHGGRPMAAGERRRRHGGHVHAAGSDPELGEHRLRAARHRARGGTQRRRGDGEAPRHPIEAGPLLFDHLGQRGREPAGDDQRLRHDRQPRLPEPRHADPRGRSLQRRRVRADPAHQAGPGAASQDRGPGDVRAGPSGGGRDGVGGEPVPLHRVRQDRHRPGQRGGVVLRIHPGDLHLRLGRLPPRPQAARRTSRACRPSTAARSPLRSGRTT